MYGIEGFPESIYNTAKKINKEWQKSGVGQIRTMKTLKYHGKVYVFIKNSVPFACIVGSHNMGALTVDANNRRQYELSACSEEQDECRELYEHVTGLLSEPISYDISTADGLTIIREENRKLEGVEFVKKAPKADVEDAQNNLTGITFELPLKVPGMPGTNKDFMASNINKCYAKGRENKRTGVVKERGWWETEIIVSNSITSNVNYPAKDIPFYVVTDDGWEFYMHVSGDYKKNFESHFDLKILGYWLKGRLVAAGIVDPVDSPSEDLATANGTLYGLEKCKGVITYKKLKDYGRTSLTFQKTILTKDNEDGTVADVWFLSFLPKE